MVNTGSLIINILKSIIMNIFIVLHSSNLPREYKEVGRSIFIFLNLYYYETY